ncbi:N-carbamoyl-D-amino acid hydrolase [Planctomycetes bacterium CA13]|uniref:N-carbamoyl-D-amino acid hydrolase n=1 Tax=Novipirellula herctigrandis TaxID=2527986 RepID=A0A5C5Z4E5_9BACT|nr:N-carbamoyl-D-amino acid hydrolase [Planctomycetes bacterium CA13]
MLIACVQTDIAFADFDKNRRQLVQWMHQTGEKGANLVVMPECMLSGYAYESRTEAIEQAISVHHPVFSEIGEIAKQYDMHVTFGFLEKDDDHLFNSVVMIGPAGIAGQYRKIHLPHLGVDRFVDRGDFAYQPFSAGPAKVGLAICYDSSFPEPMRVLALEGADIIALGTNWPSAAQRTAEIVPPARSMENHIFFAAANRIGSEGGFEFCGHSSICGPDGVILAQSHDAQPTILYADVDLEQARNKRIERTPGAHVIDRFQDRCPRFYGAITKKTTNNG